MSTPTETVLSWAPGLLVRPIVGATLAALPGREVTVLDTGHEQLLELCARAVSRDDIIEALSADDAAAQRIDHALAELLNSGFLVEHSVEL
jgi:hypothetical protein